MIRNAVKHVQDEVRTPEMVDPILEIYEAAAGATLTERPYFSVTNCTIAPLQHDKEMTEAGLMHVRARRADLRAAHAADRHDRPRHGARDLHHRPRRAALRGRPLPAREAGLRHDLGVAAGVADMRTGGYIAAGPEIGIINMICVEMASFYGLPVAVHRHVGRRQGGRLPGGSEGGMTALCAALVGCDSLIAAGGLDGIQISSLAKIVLDNDQIGALRRYMREDADRRGARA